MEKTIILKNLKTLIKTKFGIKIVTNSVNSNLMEQNIKIIIIMKSIIKCHKNFIKKDLSKVIEKKTKNKYHEMKDQF